jgi:hypothetical protein
MILVKTKGYSFRERAPEWILSAGLLVYGLMLALNPTLYETSFYAPLLRVMSQESWTISTVFIAVFRLLALAVNGAWRPTAHFRALGAVGGVIIWSSLFIISVTNAQARAPGIGTFGMLLAFDFLALWWAAGDAKLVDQIAKRQRGADGNNSRSSSKLT